VRLALMGSFTSAQATILLAIMGLRWAVLTER